MTKNLTVFILLKQIVRALQELYFRIKMIDNYRLMNNAQIGFQNNSIHFEALNFFYNKKEVDKLEELIRTSLLLAQKLKQIDNKHFDDGSFNL
jgi:choline kinase